LTYTVDSDTIVPEDCLLDAVSEMEQYPEVGILQYNSGVMVVAEDFFINGIT
jgi:membrane glycosyltransferase